MPHVFVCCSQRISNAHKKQRVRLFPSGLLVKSAPSSKESWGGSVLLSTPCRDPPARDADLLSRLSPVLACDRPWHSRSRMLNHSFGHRYPPRRVAYYFVSVSTPCASCRALFIPFLRQLCFLSFGFHPRAACAFVCRYPPRRYVFMPFAAFGDQ